MASAIKLTLRGLADAIIALKLPSVAEVYPAPPESENTADLPSMWPTLPSLATNDSPFACDVMTKDVTMGIVIAVEPNGQSAQDARFNLAIKLGDELRTALDGLKYSLFSDYTINVSTSIDVAGTGYWGIVAEYTARNDE